LCSYLQFFFSIKQNQQQTAEFVWEWFFSVCCAHACQALPFRSELANNTLRNQRLGTFLYPQFWMP